MCKGCIINTICCTPTLSSGGSGPICGFPGSIIMESEFRFGFDRMEPSRMLSYETRPVWISNSFFRCLSSNTCMPYSCTELWVKYLRVFVARVKRNKKQFEKERNMPKRRDIRKSSKVRKHMMKQWQNCRLKVSKQTVMQSHLLGENHFVSEWYMVWALSQYVSEIRLFSDD